jgi:ribosomal protein L25 (general stress protein Ctc)
MAEVILKAEMIEGDVISIVYDRKTENVKIKIESSKKTAEVQQSEDDKEE